MTATGGPANNTLEASQDDVTDVSELPLQSFHDHNLRILNSDTQDDDYYLKYVAADGVGGKGYWQETRARNTSPGITSSTMPHELSNTGATTFAFGPIGYKQRLTGDINTNPHPSFVAKKISSTFFYNNRFGVLAEDNVNGYFHINIDKLEKKYDPFAKLTYYDIVVNSCVNINR